MPVRCEFRLNGVIAWHYGVVTGEDLIGVNTAIYSHEDSRNFQFQLLHLLEVTRFEVKADVMRKLAAMDAQMHKEAKQYACAVAPTDHIFGMSRIWYAHAEVKDFQPHVVRTYEEAVEWFRTKGIEVD